MSLSPQGTSTSTIESLQNGVKLLIVEGKDDEVFLKKLLDSQAITGVIIRVVAGKDNFRTLIPAIAKEYEDIDILAVIRDADEDAQTAFQSIQDVLRRTETIRGHRLTAPNSIGTFAGSSPRAGVYIASGDDGIGAIEDVCRFAIAPQYRRRVDCATQLLTCIANPSPSKSKNGKIILQAFLSTTHEEGSIICDIGTAAERGYWNFNAPSLEPLKAFLETFR